MDESYFRRGATWSDRVAETLEGSSSFVAANAKAIERWIDQHEHGVRIVINVPADALLAMLEGDRYRNKYELEAIGKGRGPSPRRLAVDVLLGFVPDGRDWYFGAVALGGAGVRFYGEYCLVLRPGRDGKLQLLDRNSYDLTDPPLQGQPQVVDTLKGEWDDLVRVVTLKVLPHLRGIERLVTVGAIAEIVLHDEDFIETQLYQPGGDGVRGLRITDVEEIRQAPEDVAQEQHILLQYRRNRFPDMAGLVWSSRRTQVEQQLERHDLESRVVTTDGRGARWR